MWSVFFWPVCPGTKPHGAGLRIKWEVGDVHRTRAPEESVRVPADTATIGDHTKGMAARKVKVGTIKQQEQNIDQINVTGCWIYVSKMPQTHTLCNKTTPISLHIPKK